LATTPGKTLRMLRSSTTAAGMEGIYPGVGGAR
jgi:hypothetical protein